MSFWKYRWAFSVAGLLAGVSSVAAGCSASPKPPEAERTATSSQAVTLSNGFVQNGLNSNGLFQNGFISNGFISNGFISNGFISNGFISNGFISNGFISNGFISNGFISNGFISNGFISNGFISNGLLQNGFLGNGFFQDNAFQDAPPGSTGATYRTMLASNAGLRQLVRYIYSCAMPSSMSATIDPNKGTLPCTSSGGGGGAGGGPSGGDSDGLCGLDVGSCGAGSGYACINGTCVVPLCGQVGLGYNADGSNWWTPPPTDAGAPDSDGGIISYAGVCDDTCQRWVSACVLARTNAYGVHVKISMRAPPDAPQVIKDALAVSDAERNGVDAGDASAPPYALREGAYYGNIFAATPYMVDDAGALVPAPQPYPDGGVAALEMSTPIYTACAGPGSNVPEITKRFCSSQGDQVVIGVPGVCLKRTADAGATLQQGTCAGQDTDASSPTYGAIQGCCTTPGTSVGADGGPQCAAGGTPYSQVVTVYLQDPIATCGNTVCEPPTETTTSCPSDCHPGGWAGDLPAIGGGIWGGTDYSGVSLTESTGKAGEYDSITTMSAVAHDGTGAVAVTGLALDIQGNPLDVTLSNGVTLSKSGGPGVLIKYNADGSYAWSFAGIRFGTISTFGFSGGFNHFSVAGASVAPNGNITVVAFALPNDLNNKFYWMWIGTYDSSGTPIGASGGKAIAINTPLFIPDKAMALDGDGNVVLAENYVPKWSPPSPRGTDITLGSSPSMCPYSCPYSATNPGTCNPQCILLAKVSPLGAVLWTSSLYDPGSVIPRSLVVDKNDNVVLTVSNDPGPAIGGNYVHRLCPDGSGGPSSSTDAGVASVACGDGGTEAWTTASLQRACSSTGTLCSDIFSAVAVDSNGDVYATGQTNPHGYTYALPYLSKYRAADGELLWTAPLPTVGCSLPPEITSSPGHQPASPLGCNVYSTQNGYAPGAARGEALGFDRAGNPVVASYGDVAPGGTLDFGVGGAFPNYNANNVYLSAYEPDAGAPQWAKQIPIILSSELLGMAIDPSGRVVMSGNYSGSMQPDDQFLVTSDSETYGVLDSFVSAFCAPSPKCTTPPTIGAATDQSGQPINGLTKNITAQATSSAGATVFFTPPTAIDNCGGADGGADGGPCGPAPPGVSVVCSPLPNTTFPLTCSPPGGGPAASPCTTTVTCTASDPFGNSSNATFTVMVIDTLPPLLAPVPPVTQQATSQSGANVNYTLPTAVDQVDGARPVTCGVASGDAGVVAPADAGAGAPGSLFPVGTTTVTCSSNDTRGNQSQISFTVTVTAPFGVACGDAGQCAAGTCVDGVCCNTTATSCGACMACNVAGSAGTCAPVSNGSACTGTNACMQTYSCQAGVCTGSNPVICTASDQCHSAGTCDQTSGTCSSPTVTEGTACTGSNACMQTYTCQAGVCTGSNPVVCTAQDQCHVAGTCSSGVCSNPAVPDGMSCTFSACTTGSTCTGGTCIAGPSISCDDNNPCTVDTCDSVAGCQNTAGNAGVQCGTAAGPCDVAATCTGTSATCPPNGFLPTTTLCQPESCSAGSGASGAVDTLPSYCSGSAASCLPAPISSCGLYLGCQPVADAGASTCATRCASVNDCVTSAYCATVTGTDGGSSASCQPDVDPPAITVTSALAAYTNQASQTVSFTVTDNGAVALVQVSLNGAARQTLTAVSPGAYSAPLTLAQGTNSITLMATDRAGNASSQQLPVVLVPSTFAPAIAFSSPLAGQAFGTTSIAVAVQVTTNALATVSIEGGSAVSSCTPAGGASPANGSAAPLQSCTSTLAATLSFSASGTQTLTATATDLAGNTTSVSETVLIDLSAPGGTISIADGARLGPLPGNLLPVSITVNDVGATAVTLSTATGTTTCFAGGAGNYCLARGGGVVQTTVPLAQGTDSFTVTVVDEVGKSSQLTRTVVYDTTPPSGTLVFPANAGFVRGTVDLSADVTDNLTGVASVTFAVDPGTDGGTALTGAAQPNNPTNFTALLATKSLSDGAHALVVTMVDGVGNQSQLSSTFVVDNTAPTVSVTSPAAGAYVESTISISATASDATSGVASIALLVNGSSIGSCTSADGGLGSGSSATCTLPFNTASLPDGQFTVTAQAADGAGNQASAQVTATSDNKVPSAFLVSPQPGQVVTGSSVTVAVNVTTAYFATVQCSLNGTSLGAPSTSPTFSTTVSLSGTPDGLATVTCNATDKAGAVGAQSVQFSLRRWNFELQPRVMELSQRGGTVSGEVTGPNVSILLPPGDGGSWTSGSSGNWPSLVVCSNTAGPGGPCVPAGSPVLAGGSGTEHTGDVLLTFSRAQLVDAVRGSIAMGKLNPRAPFFVSLFDGSHEVDADLISIERWPCWQ